MRPALVLLLVLAAAASACAKIRSISDGPRRIEPSERSRVEAQVENAIRDEEWAAAWNQLIDLGAPRDRMEDVALRALEADAGQAEDMLAALTAKWGGLSDAARLRGRKLAERAEKEGDWERAVEIEILLAEDAPHYHRAWEIYDRAPPTKAPQLLELIADARDEAAEGSD